MNTCVYVLLARYLWVQCQCEPRAIELVRIAEAMPDFAACFLQDAKVLQVIGSCKKKRLPWNPINHPAAILPRPPCQGPRPLKGGELNERTGLQSWVGS